MNQIELSKKDIQMLVRSLENCIATCATHAKKKTALCKDCDSADDLKKRLKVSLKS